MKTVGVSHIGNVRSTNEDTLLISCDVKPRYMLVADGMGGHAAGEIASRIAAQSIRQYIEDLGRETLSRGEILDAIEFANHRILDRISEDESLTGMGTTLTFAYAGPNMLTIAQVGDSSAFLFDGKSLEKVTKDHTYVQYLIDTGVIEEQEDGEYPFKNIITRALGMNKLEADIYTTSWQAGDTLLLCSDGLTNYLGREEMEKLLAGETPIEKKAKWLLNRALYAGGKDNISIIIAYNDDGEDMA